MELSICFQLIPFAISLLFFLFFYLLLRLRLRPLLDARKNLPPGPTPLPVLGNFFELGRTPHRSFTRLSKTYGPLMTLNFGSRTVIVASSPEMAKQVLQRNGQAFSGRPTTAAICAVGHNEGSVVWSPADQRWRNLRRICNAHLFAPQRLDESRPLRRQKIRELVAYVSYRSSVGLPVDVGRAAFATSLNVISRTVFSVDFTEINAENNAAQESFENLVHEIVYTFGTPSLFDFFPLLASLDPLGTKRHWENTMSKFYAFFDEQIDRRLREEEEKKTTTESNKCDFLDALLRIQNQGDRPNKFGREAIRALIADLFVAGTHTSSGTVEWAMAELLRNPDAMTNVRRELNERIRDDRGVEESDIEHLKYLQAVVKETLRLHPIAPFLFPRQAGESVQLCGYTVPEHACLLVNVWAIGRDEKIWSEPERFVPERFMDSGVDFRGKDYELAVFGAGQRICPGLPLAHRVVHLMLASFVHRFEWELLAAVDGADKDLELMNDSGIPLAMAVPRQQQSVELF